MCSFSCVLNIISTLVEKTLSLKAWWKSLFQMKASTKPHKVPLTVLASDFPVFYICVLFSPWLSVTVPWLTVCSSGLVENCFTEELHFLMNDNLQFWDAWPQAHKVPFILSNTFRYYCQLGHVVWLSFLGHSFTFTFAHIHPFCLNKIQVSWNSTFDVLPRHSLVSFNGLNNW